MAVQEEQIRLEPSDVFYGLRNKDTVTCVADTTDSLLGTYFDMETVDLDGVVTQYRVHFGGAPAAGGRTLVDAGAVTDDTAEDVAEAARVAMAASIPGATTRRSGAVLTTENNAIGAMTAAAEGGTPTGFAFASVLAGAKDDLGGTDGAIEFSIELSLVDVKADQFGETLLDQVQNGNNLTASMSLLEVTEERWKQIVGNISGDSYTPAGGTEVTGLGGSKRFKNMKQYARELVLKPSNSSDNLRNIHIWRAFPNLESINFSGTELQKMELSFNAYQDSGRRSEVSLFAFGDGVQDLTA